MQTIFAAVTTRSAGCLSKSADNISNYADKESMFVYALSMSAGTTSKFACAFPNSAETIFKFKDRVRYKKPNNG